MVNSDRIANLTSLNLKAAEHGLARAQKWLGTMYKKRSFAHEYEEQGTTSCAT